MGGDDHLHRRTLESEGLRVAQSIKQVAHFPQHPGVNPAINLFNAHHRRRTRIKCEGHHRQRVEGALGKIFRRHSFGAVFQPQSEFRHPVVARDHFDAAKLRQDAHQLGLELGKNIGPAQLPVTQHRGQVAAVGRELRTVRSLRRGRNRVVVEQVGAHAAELTLQGRPCCGAGRRDLEQVANIFRNTSEPGRERGIGRIKTKNDFRTVRLGGLGRGIRQWQAGQRA